LTERRLLPTPARAFWVAAPGQGELRLESLPEPGPGEVLVHTLFSAVSRGSESLVFRGKVPVSEYERMRCPYQQGDFPGPLKYGYSNVGRVVLGPPELEGRAVFCLFPHQTSYVIEADAVVPLPDGVPVERAVLAANLETAVNALWDARPLLGDSVSVIGAGVVGCLLARLLARVPGVEVELVDVRAEREAVAWALGVDFRLPEAASPERDLVFHASASEAGLCTALELAGRGATIMELSWYGDQAVALPLGADFHARRLTLASSQVGTMSHNARPRFDYSLRLAFALSLLNDPAFDVLFTEEEAFDALPQSMKRLSDPATDVLCHRVRYG
jgi:threonine dehydrogenase-like Zn-dependent dehydrogenase